jgi:biotin operon repressor
MKTRSQNALILAHLKKTGSITPSQASSLGITRLAARIYDLRSQGVDLITDVKKDYRICEWITTYTLSQWRS